jgi:hypothetical protein
MSAEQAFRTDYFLRIVDQALQSMEAQFKQYEAHNDNFGFLYCIDKLNNMTNDYLLKCCKDLDLLLQSGASRDINGVDLYSELLLSRDYMKASGLEGVTALDALMCIHRNAASFPNLCIAMRILLTMPVTVASTERSFSQLKLLKT